MSRQLIRRNEDLRKLDDEGYEVDVREGMLVVGHVPYLDSNGTPQVGTIVCPLKLVGETTVAPDDHTVFFAGTHPCNRNRDPIDIAINSNARMVAGVPINFQFSRWPRRNYYDHHEQVTTYVALISGPAMEVDPETTALTHRIVETREEESVFLYADTASARARITELSKRLAQDKVAIVGLGGTGSYILDLVAKTHVREIHLFDDDLFASHNAFRSPGAASLEDLHAHLSKSDHFAAVYSKMRRGVIPHGYLDASNVQDLSQMDFVFMATDSGVPKQLAIPVLRDARVPFIDVGMGVYEVEPEGPLSGQLRVTTVTPDDEGSLATIPTSSGGGKNVYDQNIQLCELNAFNAALAVMKWKRLRGFYHDGSHENLSIFQLDGNIVINERRP